MDKGRKLSAILVVSKLKCFWLLFFLAALLFAILGGTAFRECLAGQLLMSALMGAFIALGSNAFTRQPQFLLRGMNDRVYLVRNQLFYPRIYELADPETKNALGGFGKEVPTVSDGSLGYLYRLFGRKN